MLSMMAALGMDGEQAHCMQPSCTLHVNGFVERLIGTMPESGAVDPFREQGPGATSRHGMAGSL